MFQNLLYLFIMWELNLRISGELNLGEFFQNILDDYEVFNLLFVFVDMEVRNFWIGM